MLGRSPSLLPCLLRVLRCCLFATRRNLQRQLLFATNDETAVTVVATETGAETQTPAFRQEAERDEMVRALIGAQESACVQILLEMCLSDADEKVTHHF